MNKIFASLIIIGVVGAAVTGATVSYFTDTETSSGNTFTAGKIDLKIDNQSYYNGTYSPEMSWNFTDLENQLFFDYSDLKFA